MERKGFTLIELMIVIAIIIILAAIAIPNYLRMTERAKVSAIESDLKAIGTALETYNTDWTTYPTGNWDACKAELTAGTGATSNVSPNKTVTGESAPIVYITPQAIAAFETKVGYDSSHTDRISYSVTNGEYKLIATASIGGKTYTFTMTPGGQITVSAT